jgi:nucleotide-binding universal stress UspA family protein
MRCAARNVAFEHQTNAGISAMTRRQQLPHPFAALHCEGSMFKEILVPVDRSACAASALAQAASIARVFDSRITVLHVMEASRAIVPALANPIDWQINRMEAETFLQQQVDHLHAGGVNADFEVVEGDPATRIHAYARDRSIDLIVLSAHGQASDAGWNLGSVAQKIVNMAQTSLLLVRPASGADALADALEDAVFHKIMLPLDASQRAECVLPAAIMLSQKMQAEVLLAHVAERPRMPRRMPLSQKERKLSEAVMELNRADAERYLAGLKERFSVPTRTCVVQSESAALTLHHLAAQEQCDLVMLSAHGHTSNMAWPYGSLVASFIAHGSTSVMMIQDMNYTG